MDIITLFLFSITSFIMACTYVFLFKLLSRNPRPKNLPPGPPPYPIIGNILDLKITKFHQYLNNLSNTYGPIISLKIGNISTIVISSASTVKEAFQKNDQAFASRMVPQAVQALEHHQASIIFMPSSNQKWKTLRKLCVSKIFSPQLLDSTEDLRGRKLLELLGFLQERCKRGEAIDIGETVFTTVLNSMSNTLFSVDLADRNSDSSQKFREIIWSVLIEASKYNIADYFPILSLFDPQGAKRRVRKYFQELLTVFESIIEERIHKEDSAADNNDDVLELILRLIKMENSEFTRHDISHLFLDLFIGGVDSTASTVQWAMAELLHNPEKMIKTKKELQQFLSKDQQFLKATDISKLPYLQAIINEALRLHPAAPILVHKSEVETQTCGFTVPKGTLVLVNVWALGRDPSIWPSPNVFLPERFLEGDDERKFRGSNNNDYGFIPFGVGRRMCPGVPFAHRVAHTVLALLLQHFDWKLEEDGKNHEDMDMEEAYGITLHKVKGLRLIPIPIKIE